MVFHEAAIPSVPQSMAEPLENHEANATGTLSVLERAPGRPACAAWSTRRRRRPTATRPTLPKVETMPPAPISPYGALEAGRRALLQVYARAYGLETVCLRYFNVFGPRQDPKSEYAAVIPKFITAALAGQAAAHLRRRHAVARLLLHRQRRRGELQAAAGRRGAQVSGGVFNIACGAGDRPQSGRGAHRRHPGPEDRARLTSRSAPATSSTRWPTSARRAAARLHRRRLVRRRAAPHDRLVSREARAGPRHAGMLGPVAVP